jgi:hypothetical protein
MKDQHLSAMFAADVIDRRALQRIGDGHPVSLPLYMSDTGYLRCIAIFVAEPEDNVFDPFVFSEIQTPTQKGIAIERRARLVQRRLRFPARITHWRHSTLVCLSKSYRLRIEN